MIVVAKVIFICILNFLFSCPFLKVVNDGLRIDNLMMGLV